jgi:N-acetylmuramic acid 6-phosphate etherase
MALTGSTRMQATTIAMLVYGAALEEALTNIVMRDNFEFAARAQAIPPLAIRHTYAQLFHALLEQLTHGDALRGLAALIDLEAEVYSKQGRVTYIAERYLLDIFSDTTERTPTFMLPPFRKHDDENAPVPWAFAKDPLHPTQDAWSHLLQRAPRGLNWTREDYIAMRAQSELVNHPPALDNAEIHKYRIGKEDDPTRYNAPAPALLWFHLDEAQAPDVAAYFRAHASQYTHPTLVTMGATTFTMDGARTVHLPLHVPPTALNLFYHLAVKLVCNTLSTGTMGKLGRILGNWMIQVDAINKKLVDRAIRIVADLGGMTYEQACVALYQTIDAPEMDRLLFRDSYVMQTLRRRGIPLPDTTTK